MKIFKAKKIVRYYRENATTHGIAAIHHFKNTYVKALILLLFLSLFVSMVKGVTYTFMSFFEYKVYTSVEIEQHHKMPFPGITICRNNYISSFNVNESLRNEILKKTKDINSGKIKFDEIDDFIINTTYEVRASMENSNHTIPSFPPMILPTLAGSCLFAKTGKCKFTRDFKPTDPLSSNGRCYTFHGGEEVIYMQRGSGPNFGLRMILYVNQSDSLPIIGTRDGAGFTVYIHEQKTLPLMEKGGIFVAPGFYTKIAIRMNELISKPYPYHTNCSDGRGTVNLVPGEYSSFNCQMSCLFESVLKKCGYVEPAIRGYIKKQQHQKTNISMLRCRDEVVEDIFQGEALPCNCPRACREISYLPVVSFSRWPVDSDRPTFRALSQKILGKDSSNITNDFLDKNLLKVDVYFDEMDIKKYVERQMVMPYDLLSNIGGHLGLWTGSSLFSIFEWLIALPSLIVFLLQSAKVKSSKRHNFPV